MNFMFLLHLPYNTRSFTIIIPIFLQVHIIIKNEVFGRIVNKLKT